MPYASHYRRQPAAARRQPAARPSRPGMATAKQIAYIRALLRDVGTDNMSIKGIPNDLSSLTVGQASALIDDIKGN